MHHCNGVWRRYCVFGGEYRGGHGAGVEELCKQYTSFHKVRVPQQSDNRVPSAVIKRSWLCESHEFEITMWPAQLLLNLVKLYTIVMGGGVFVCVCVRALVYVIFFLQHISVIMCRYTNCKDNNASCYILLLFFYCECATSWKHEYLYRYLLQCVAYT